MNLVRDVLPSSRNLSAAEIRELKREHRDTILPAKRSRDGIFDSERELSELVNDAYGPNQSDVNLLWKTAPLRMPFTDVGLTSEDDELSPEDEEDEG